MGNTKSELDLLKQKNARLLVENTELRNENAKLRQDIEGHETRITKLEQGEKSITNVLQSSVNIISSKMENSNNTPASDVTEDTSNSDISEQVENRSNICQERDSQCSAPPRTNSNGAHEQILASTRYKNSLHIQKSCH